jgi:O-antigen/teichoic acid export membrane protein
MALLQGISVFSRRELRAVVIYTFSNFLNKGVSFLLLFYFIHTLSGKDFGQLSLFNNGILLMTPFVSLGILQSVNAEYFKKDREQFAGFFSTTLLMPVLVTVLFMLVMTVFHQSLISRYGFSFLCLLLMPLIALFSFLNEHLINLLRNNHEPLTYLFINLGRLIAELTLAVFFISALETGWMGRVAGIFIAYLMTAVYAIYYFREKGLLKWVFQKKYLREELRFSLPVIMMQLGVFCMGASPVFFIEYFTNNLETVGIFNVANTFSSVILVLCTALLQYSYPKIYSLLAAPQADYQALRWQLSFFAGMLLLGTGLLVIATPILYPMVLKNSYQEGLSYFFFLCLGNWCWSVSYLLYAFMLFHKQKKKLLLASLLSVTVSIISHTLFTRFMGAEGAAYSVFIVYVIVLMITMFMVRNELRPIFFSPVRKSNISS